MIGDYNLAGISERLDFESMAFVNREADAQHLEKCLPRQAQNQDFVMIQCGSNNLKEELRHSLPSLGSMLNTALKTCQGQVLVNAVPGQLFGDQENDLAVRINTFLKHRCLKSNRLHYINCNPSLKQENFARDGYHFSEKGKLEYARHLSTSLSVIRNFVSQPHWNAA
jgi:hypothetical protein